MNSYVRCSLKPAFNNAPIRIILPPNNKNHHFHPLLPRSTNFLEPPRIFTISPTFLPLCFYP